MSQRNYRLPVPDMQATNSPRENILYNATAQNPDMLGFLVGARGNRMAASADYLESMQRLAEMQKELFRMSDATDRLEVDARVLDTIAKQPDSALMLSSIAERVNPDAVNYIGMVGPQQRMAEINRQAAQANEANSNAGLRPAQGTALSNFGLPIAPRTQGMPTSVMSAAAGNTGGSGGVELSMRQDPQTLQLFLEGKRRNVAPDEADRILRGELNIAGQPVASRTAGITPFNPTPEQQRRGDSIARQVRMREGTARFEMRNGRPHVVGIVDGTERPYPL